jgi:hypothetical protein
MRRHGWGFGFRAHAVWHSLLLGFWNVAKGVSFFRVNIEQSGEEEHVEMKCAL